jgi:hypothetical protein
MCQRRISMKNDNNQPPKPPKTELKVRKIEEALKNKMGVLVRNQTGTVVSVFGEDEQRLLKQYANNGHRAIYILGSCNTSGNLLVAKNSIQYLGSTISSIISARDLQFEMFRDMLCSFIKARVFDIDDEEVMAFSFIIIQYEKAPRNSPDDPVHMNYVFSLVNHLGDYESIPPTVSYHIFGCSDENKVEEAKNFLQAANVAGLGIEELKELPQKVISEVMYREPTRMEKAKRELKPLGIPDEELSQRAKEAIIEEIRREKLETIYWDHEPDK